jgi:hypothetical protein
VEDYAKCAITNDYTSLIPSEDSLGNECKNEILKFFTEVLIPGIEHEHYDYGSKEENEMIINQTKSEY